MPSTPAFLTIINLCVSDSQAQRDLRETAVPRLVLFSGIVKEPAGKPAVSVTFAFYKVQEGDVPLWMETQNVAHSRLIPIAQETP